MATYLIWNKVQSHYHSLQGSSRSEPHLSLRSQFLLLINSFVSMTTKMLPRYHTTSPCSTHSPSLIDIMACFLLSPQSFESPLPFPFPALDLSPCFTKEQQKLPEFHMLPPPYLLTYCHACPFILHSTLTSFYLRPTSPTSVPSSHSFIINVSLSSGLFSSAYKHTIISPFLKLKKQNTISTLLPVSQLCTPLQLNSSKEISILPLLPFTLDPTATIQCKSKANGQFSNCIFHEPLVSFGTVHHPFLDTLTSRGLQDAIQFRFCSWPVPALFCSLIPKPPPEFSFSNLIVLLSYTLTSHTSWFLCHSSNISVQKAFFFLFSLHGLLFPQFLQVFAQISHIL